MDCTSKSLGIGAGGQGILAFGPIPSRGRISRIRFWTDRATNLVGGGQFLSWEVAFFANAGDAAAFVNGHELCQDGPVAFPAAVVVECVLGRPIRDDRLRHLAVLFRNSSATDMYFSAVVDIQSPDL